MWKTLLVCCVWIIASASYAQVYRPYEEGNDKGNSAPMLFSLPANTTKLSLKKQDLAKFPRELLRFKQLQTLDLSANAFLSLPDEIGELRELRVLRLAVNNLKTLPAGFAKLQKLEELDISYNLFEKFPQVITQLPNLKILNVGGNRLKLIPEGISKLQRLTMFHCPFNELIKLPKGLSDLPALTSIQANNNRIKDVPKEFGQMPALITLMLYNNEITAIPKELGNIKSLADIDVSKNVLQEVPVELSQVLAMRTLYLRKKGGDIPAIPDDVLRYVRDHQVKTDIDDKDLANRLSELARRDQDKQRLADSERDKFRLETEKARREAELAEARAKNAERERQLEEARRRSDMERAALQQAEAESRRLQLERDKERSELEAKLATEKANKEKEGAMKERLIAQKERAANAEIARQQKIAEKANIERRKQEEKLNRTYLYGALAVLFFAFLFILYMIITNRKVKQKQIEAEMQRAKADKLLLNILPIQVADELKEKGVTEVKHFENASILFADVKGFSALASKVTPQELIKELDATFGKFDDVIMQYGLERIKTIGDCYMCVGGVPNPDPANIIYMIAAAIEIQNWMAEEHIRRAGDFWQVRLGVHVGDLVAGVIGKTKFAYDVWGHAVNTASRMESGGEVSRVNISVDTYERIKEFFVCSYRGKIEAKNIGLVDTYFVDAIKPEFSQDGAGKLPNEEFKRRANTLRKK